MSVCYISSTYEDLREHRELVYRALRRLQHDVRAMEDYVATDERPVDKCLADVAACDIYIGIIAFRRGFEPPEANPERCSITQLEYRKANEYKKDRLIFMLSEDAPWPVKFVDVDDLALRVRAFRTELASQHVVAYFRTGHELAEFVTAAVALRSVAVPLGAALPIAVSGPGASLRAPMHFAFPDSPYPLLGPYENPAVFAGRDAEIEELDRRIRQSQLVLCLHASSGAGKSSLLMAGLAPRLREQGYPVSVERRPGEPGLAGRLVADLFDVPQDFSMPDDQPDLFVAFAAWMGRAQRLAKMPPVLIVDQLDDVLRLPADSGRDSALARLGPLLAATARRLPADGGYPCRWVLCYRHEFHGEVDEWLRDILSQARLAGREGLEMLPYDLSDPSRSHTWSVPLFGMPLPGQQTLAASRKAFLGAIQRPIVRGSRFCGSVRFIDHGAERLAEAFARARARALTAPLVPELQVVLGYFLDRAARDKRGNRLVTIPPDAAQLDRQIDEALAAHVRRAIETAFPLGRNPEPARKARAQALLALRELVDDLGRRGEGRTRDDLVAAFGPDGDKVLETLSSPTMRLIVQERREADDRLVYVLSHDRLAEVVARFIETQSARGLLDVDDRVVELRRFVAQRSDLFLRAHDDTAIALTREQHELIQEASGALLLTDEHRGWWREADGWFELSMRFQDPHDGFRALVELTRRPGADWARLTSRLRSASINPLLFWQGPWASCNLAPGRLAVCASEILEVVERTHPAFVDSTEMVRAMAYAAEEVMRLSSEDCPGVRKIRERFGVMLKNHGKDRIPRFRGDFWHLPDEVDLGFVRIPSGKFTMGSVQGASGARPEEWPAHDVEVQDFYIGRYPVTVAQFRAFVETAAFRPEDHECLTGLPEYPVVRISWFEALEYCNWLTRTLLRSHETPVWLARLLKGEEGCAAWRVTLPSEAEWEKSARGTDGRVYPWGSSVPHGCANYSETTRGRPNLVGEFPEGASPYGVLDMSGNVWEWTRSLWGQDAKKPEFGYPYQPDDGRERLTASTNIARVLRGGSFLHVSADIRATRRHRHDPDGHSGTVGFRVVLSSFCPSEP